MSKSVSSSQYSTDLQQQMKPVMIGMTSLEKAIQIQERLHQDSLAKLTNQMETVMKTNNEILHSGILSLLQPFPLATTSSSTSTSLFPLTTNTHFQKYLTALIDDCLRNANSQPFHSPFLNKAQVESLVSVSQEYLLKQYSMNYESMRLELTSLLREDLELFKTKVTHNLQEANTTLTDLT
jgi:hypothetical protein